MWQKLIACTFVMAGACGFGYSLCKEMENDIEELKIEKQMLLYITGEISYIHRPLNEIFDMLSGRIQMPFCKFLGTVSNEMEKRDGKSLKRIWSEETVIFKMEYGLSKLGSMYLERMAECFGCEGDKIQVEALELLRCDIEREIENLLEKKKENDRLIRVLSTLAGVLCVVLFL